MTTSDLPKAFIDMLRETGDPDLATLPEALTGNAAMTAVRLNKAKNGLPPAPVHAPVQWTENGVYLAQRPSFSTDPTFHQGRYFVQDASSMAHEAAVKAAVDIVGHSGTHLRYLDACAAPGGKTIAAADILPDDSLIVANEVDRKRSFVLAEIIAKWGRSNVIVTRCDATSMNCPTEFFDIITADVPCSGEGMMRKDPEAVAQWTPALVTKCAATQREIVDNLWKALRPGGCLIYSTCTFNTSENEGIISYLINTYGAETIPVRQLQRPEIAGAINAPGIHAYRFIPGKVDGEGQFIALLQKPGSNTDCHTAPRKPKKAKKQKQNSHDSLPDPNKLLDGQFCPVVTKASAISGAAECVLSAIPAHLADDFDTIEQLLHPIAQGVEIGIIKGRDLIPSQALALSPSLRDGIYPRVDIGIDDAFEYLRRNAITIPDAPKGIILLTYGNIPLGFVKNLGNRANNLYPMQWRITASSRL